MADDQKPVADPQDQPAPAPQADAGSQPAPQQDANTDRHGRQLYDVVCSECGKPAKVPFKPSGDRPVYCQDCFRNKRMNRGPRR